MNKRRLLKLADLLEADAKNKKGIKFDLNYFVRPDDPKEPSATCNTTACAVGLACVSGAFKRSGLGMVLSSNGFEIIPKFKRRFGEEAARSFFGIKGTEFYFLFMPGSYLVGDSGSKAERAVAKRIRDFVAGKVSP